MNKFIFTSICLMLFSTMIAQNNIIREIHENHGAEQCIHTRLRAESKKKELAKSHAAQNLDITYTRAEWFIDPSYLYIKGKITTYFKPLNSNVSIVTLELDTVLHVDSVKYHGSSVSFADSGSYMLNIYLPGALSLSSVDSLTIYYQGAPTATGFGSFIQDTHNATPIIWTLSEPYGAREWWPCKNDLSDKIDSIDIIVSCPAAYRAASNGVLISETQNGQNKSYHWRHRYPIATYLVAIAVTNYAVYSDFAQLQNSTVEILNYVFPEDSLYATQNTPNTVTCMQLYSNLFVEYPFADEKYGHAQFGWGGGMEHQTMSFMGGFGHELVSHELAHQWFGDMVTCGSWEDIWLNEGFATYLTGLTYENVPTLPYWENWKQGKIGHIISAPDGSVFCSDTSSVGRIFSSRLSYSKGAYVLHMLRWVCGDSAFFQGIRSYLNDVNLQHKYAKTSDLKYHLEQASGKNLTGFFDDWYYGQGYPTYSISVIDYGSGNVDVEIHQTTSHSSVSFFEMPVPIQISAPGFDTTIVFNHTQNGQIFHLTNFPFVPKSVKFDPELHIVAAASINLFVGLKHKMQDISINTFPNPATDVLFVEAEGGKILKAELIDMDGKIIQSLDYPANKFEIRLSDVGQGMYLLRMATSEGIIVQRVLKE